jgi:hypothetical protein
LNIDQECAQVLQGGSDLLSDRVTSHGNFH